MKFLRFFIIPVLLSACARVGRPTGGNKDVTPPKLLQSVPKNGMRNFNGQEIILAFDEYVTIRDVMKNLLISPPVNNLPVIVPSGIASKRFKIKFQDSLKSNTTYQINFGESIADYNENNKLKNLKLVFSTGQVIDSLSLRGKVNLIHFDDKPKTILLGLYEAEKFSDSIVFAEKPYYVAVADQNGNFEFDFLKTGNYRIIALADDNRDYKYQQGSESIGYVNQIINIPGDSLVTLNLFQELPAFSIENIEQQSANHVSIKFKGSADSLKVTVKTPLIRRLSFIDKDEWHLWYQTKQDSIRLEIPISKKRTKQFYRKRIDAKDSLQVKFVHNSRLNPLDSVILVANMPLDKADSSKVQLLADSVEVAFSFQQIKKRQFNLEFDKKFGKIYHLMLLPETLTGFTGQVNKDTLRTNFKVPKKDAFGKLILHLNNEHQKPLFVELIKNKKVVYKTPTQTGNDFVIEYLMPATYTVRIIVDANQNNHWDTGNYLRHIQPEQSIDAGKNIEIRANWEVDQSFNIEELK